MILLVAGHQDGALGPPTRELALLALGMGGDLGLPVAALIAGPDVGEMARTLASWQLDRVLVLEDSALAQAGPEHMGALVEAVIEKESPRFVLASHTSESMEFMPRIAARLGRSFIAGCSGYEQQGDRVLFTRPVFNGRLEMRLAPRGNPPYLVTLAPGSLPHADPETGSGVEPEPVTFDLAGVVPWRRRVGIEAAARGEVSLESAKVIVAVGRGIQKSENLGIVRELAEALGAPIGASRPVVDAGWLARDRQIGSSGQTVAPRLYIAIGISGAIQHRVGMQGSHCIVAINKDAEAPVFRVADYGIAGDLFEVVPELTRLVRDLRAGSRGAG